MTVRRKGFCAMMQILSRRRASNEKELVHRGLARCGFWSDVGVKRRIARSHLDP
jgi:hypothetical protein